MATIVFFHAHPDDEAIATGGTMASPGRRRATGSSWSPPPGASSGRSPRDCSLPGRAWPSTARSSSTRPAASSVWPARHTWTTSTRAWPERRPTPTRQLRHRPMSTRPQPPWPPSSRRRRRRAGHLRRARGLRSPRPHPGAPGRDRAAELAGTPIVYMATMNRDFMVRASPSRTAQTGSHRTEAPTGMETMGEPASRITTEVDVHPWIDRKRAPCGPTPVRSARQLLPVHARRGLLDGVGTASGTSGCVPNRSTPGRTTGLRAPLEPGTAAVPDPPPRAGASRSRVRDGVQS